MSSPWLGQEDQAELALVGPGGPRRAGAAGIGCGARGEKGDRSPIALRATVLGWWEGARGNGPARRFRAGPGWRWRWIRRPIFQRAVTLL
jgi:hypothetical protein